MNNSFHINLRGEREKVLKDVVAATAPPAGSDQTQVETAKAAIASLVAALPKKFTQINVLAIGDLGPTGGEIRIAYGGSELPKPK